MVCRAYEAVSSKGFGRFVEFTVTNGCLSHSLCMADGLGGGCGHRTCWFRVFCHRATLKLRARALNALI